jgi:hypothetical protein
MLVRLLADECLAYSSLKRSILGLLIVPSNEVHRLLLWALINQDTEKDRNSDRVRATKSDHRRCQKVCMVS